VENVGCREIVEFANRVSNTDLVKLSSRPLGDFAEFARLYEKYGLEGYTILTGKNPIEHILIIFNNVTLVLDKTPLLKPANAWTIVNLKASGERHSERLRKRTQQNLR